MEIFVILALFASAYLAVRRKLGLRIDEAVLVGSLLAFLEIVVLMQALGLAGGLRSGPVWFATLSLIAVHAILAFAGRFRPPHDRFRMMPRWVIPAAVAGFLTLGIRLLIALASPPDGWDSLGYHLPFVVRWVQQGNLDLSGWAGPPRYFVWNAELLSAWLALLRGGGLLWAKVIQILALPLLAAAGSVLGRRLAGIRWAWPCALALPAIPIVMIQSGYFYVDLLYAAFWLAAAAASIAWAKTGRPIHWLAFAAAFGLALGTKSTFFFMVPLALPLAVGLWKEPRARRSLARYWPAGLLLLVAAGAGAYIRNWALTGNPIFPFRLSIAGATILRGPMAASDMPSAYEYWFVSSRWAWIVYPFWEKVRGIAGYSHLNGFGPLFALGWLTLPLAFWKAWKKRDALVLAFLGLVPSVLLIYFTLQPVRLPRYIILLAPLPILSFAYILRGARGRRRTAGRILWTLAIVGGSFGTLAYIRRSPALWEAWLQSSRGHRVDAWTYYEKGYGALGRAWRALDGRLEAGDVVAVNYGELMLPWWGVPPRARVVEVVYGGRLYPRVQGGETAERWLDAVDRSGARYLVVWSPPWNPGFGEAERGAVLSEPERFVSIESSDSGGYGRIDIFRILKPRRR